LPGTPETTDDRRHSMRRTLVAAAVAGVLTAGCATHPAVFTGDPDRQITEAEFMQLAPHITPFAQWDRDGDGFLTQAEFEAGMAETGVQAPHGFQTWDLDGDGRLSEEEFFRGTWQQLDQDETGYISERDLMMHQQPMR
jgi:Ca2+-binding EF-hand superfamily protein